MFFLALGLREPKCTNAPAIRTMYLELHDRHRLKRGGRHDSIRLQRPLRQTRASQRSQPTILYLLATTISAAFRIGSRLCRSRPPVGRCIRCSDEGVNAGVRRFLAVHRNGKDCFPLVAEPSPQKFGEIIRTLGTRSLDSHRDGTVSPL